MIISATARPLPSASHFASHRAKANYRDYISAHVTRIEYRLAPMTAVVTLQIGRDETGARRRQRRCGLARASFCRALPLRFQYNKMYHAR